MTFNDYNGENFIKSLYSINTYLMRRNTEGDRMANGLIYKYVNLINGKIYIGQTRTILERRDNKHCNSHDDNMYFHKALKKYGRNNFSLEVVEENIPIEQLDEREQYWIEYFDSYYKHNKGYNLTKGGAWGTSAQQIFGNDVIQIKKLIMNSSLTFQEIADKYNVSLSCISDVNTGRTFLDTNLEYPLRKTYSRSEMNQEKASLIIKMLQETRFSQEEIARQLNVKPYTVGQINRGKSSWCPTDLNYPLSSHEKKYTYQNILCKEDVLNIVYDLCFTNITQEQIGKKYGVAKNTIGDISRGLTWKEVTTNLIFPLRKNKIANQALLNEIYGIV